MENKYYLNTDKDIKFKTKLKVGEVVIVDYTNYKLNYRNYYISVVKDIIIDEKNNIYKCRLDNFNIDFILYNKIPFSVIAANYSNDIETGNVYKIEDYKNELEIEIEYLHLHYSSFIDGIKKRYKVLVEALLLQYNNINNKK